MAREEGLDLAGAVPVGPSPFWDAYRAWVEAGYAGGMTYLSRADAMRRRQDPRQIMPGAQTVLVVGAAYAGAPLPVLPPLHGRVARYAWGPPGLGPGADYHVWVLKRLEALVSRIEGVIGEPVVSRCYVDTGPILERAWAQAAGLGWLGKNTTLIHPRLGSTFFLGVALLDVALPPAPEEVMPSCGTCTRCLDACPTGAIVAPHVIDARRCLSYLTIEHRGVIPEVYRAAMGTQLFGCDICQDVCPWNQRAQARREGAAVPELATLHLPELLTMDADDFRARFRSTAIWRATPEGLARNAAVVLGNLRDPAGRPALVTAAAQHPSQVVREHAAWALRRLDGAAAGVT